LADAQLRPVTLAGTAAAAGQPWRLQLQLFEQAAASTDRQRLVLYVHGATFASQNSIFFKFGGASWADALNSIRFSVWALDFAGYGKSERYAEMATDTPPAGEPLGRAPEAAKQIERAVRAILSETGAPKVSIIAHSWGTMAAGRFAADNTELVDRLVFFGPIVRRDASKDESPLGPWRFITIEEQSKRFGADVPQGEPGVISEADFAAWSALYLKFDPTSGSRSPPSVKTPNGPLADIMAAWSGTLAYDPGRITARVMIVRGEWDSLCNDADVAWLRQALTGAPQVDDVKIPKATHLMHLESGRMALYAATQQFFNAK
jgi:pimeloyl-ACP methyl ester carboxylesterase